MPDFEFYSENIEYQFLGEPESRLFICRHAPRDKKRNITIIILNPIFEERSRGHRYLFNWARFLAGKGFGVIRFDYFGQGDSDGKVPDLSVETCLADLSKVYQWANALYPHDSVALHGLRWGATIAAIWSRETNSEIDHLILWEPIENGRDYIMGELRMNLTTQLIVHKKVVEDRKALVKKLEFGEPVNVDGYHLSPKLWEQIDRINLARLDYPMKTLLYKFLKPARKSSEGGPINYPTKEVKGNLTRLGSLAPTFFLEIPDYSNFNRELFLESYGWMVNG
jgi:exosortase A-associated hydrolase 2